MKHHNHIGPIQAFMVKHVTIVISVYRLQGKSTLNLSYTALEQKILSSWTE